MCDDSQPEKSTTTLVMMGNRPTPLQQQQQQQQQTITLSQAEFLDGCATVLASAFETDPIFNWALEACPPDVREKEWLPMWQGLVATQQHTYAPSFSLFLAVENKTNDPVAASIWFPPGQEMGTWDLVRSGVLNSFHRMGCFSRCVSAFSEIETSHKKTMTGPHVYLFAIGVNQSAAGCGYGSVFANSILSIVDEVGNIPCYLENSNPRNIPFYSRLGFNIVEEIRAGGDSGPPIFIMVRPPRSTQVIPISIPDPSTSPSPPPPSSTSSSGRPRPQIIALPDHDNYVVDLRKRAENAAKPASNVGMWATIGLGLGLVVYLYRDEIVKRLK